MRCLFGCGYVTRRRSPLDGLQLSQKSDFDSDSEPESESENLTVTPNYFSSVTKRKIYAFVAESNHNRWRHV